MGSRGSANLCMGYTATPRYRTERVVGGDETGCGGEARWKGGTSTAGIESAGIFAPSLCSRTTEVAG